MRTVTGGASKKAKHPAFLPLAFFTAFTTFAPHLYATPISISVFQPPQSEWISAFIGFVGVIVGAGITLAGEIYFRSRDKMRELEFNAANLVVALDQLIEECAIVACDDGNDGPPSTARAPRPQTLDPVFMLKPDKSSYMHLGSEVTYEAMRLPYRIAHIASIVNNEGAWGDAHTAIETRQFMFAKLGIDAGQLANKVRGEHKIPNSFESKNKAPTVAFDTEWRPLSALRETVVRINEKREKRKATSTGSED